MANKDKLIESAQKFLVKGQLPKAIGEYQKIVDAFPKDFRNRQKLADLLSREKRNEEALPHYEAVARNFTETGFYLKAIAIYKQMQKLEPTRGDIYLRLGELNEKQGLIGNALNEYRNLVSLYEKTHKIQEALEILRRMLALDPDNCAVRGKLIDTLLAVDEPGEAREHYCALDRILTERGDQVGLAKVHERFAMLREQTVGSSAEPAGPATLVEPAASPAPSVPPPAFDSVEDHPELAFDLDLPPAPADLPGALAPGTQAVAAVPEPSLDLDLDLAALGDFAAASLPPESAEVEVTPGDEWPGEASSLDSLELPDFHDLGLEPGVPEAPVGGPDGAVPTVVVTAAAAVAATVAVDAGAPQRPEAEAGIYEAQDLVEGPEACDETLAVEQPEAIVELEELDELDVFDDTEADMSVAGGEVPAEERQVAGEIVDLPEDAFCDDSTLPITSEVDEDAQSHFDLGIAYKEMGLLTEAIAEFHKAAHEPSRRLDCLTLQGQCLAEAGNFAAAEATFKEALGSPDLNEEVRVALRYELGLLYEITGRTLDALESFQFVADRDQFFRDVVAKQKALRHALGLDEQPSDAAQARPSRDRISYV